MSNPNPFVPKGSLLEAQGHRRSRMKLAVFCILAVSVTGLVAMLIQGCKRAPDVSLDNTSVTDTNTPADISTNVVDTNVPTYMPPPSSTNPPTAYAPPPIQPTPPTPPTPPPDMGGTEYVVVAGDTLGKIAKHEGVSLKALEAANPGVDSKHLKVKQKLTIPGKSADSVGTSAASPMGTTDSETDIYIVKSGDTLSKIAKAHGVSIKALQAANNLTTTKIDVKQKLKIPHKTEAAPVAPVENTPAPVMPPPPAPVAPAAPASSVPAPPAPGTAGN